MESIRHCQLYHGIGRFPIVLSGCIACTIPVEQSRHGGWIALLLLNAVLLLYQTPPGTEQPS